MLRSQSNRSVLCVSTVETDQKNTQPFRRGLRSVPDNRQCQVSVLGEGRDESWRGREHADHNRTAHNQSARPNSVVQSAADRPMEEERYAQLQNGRCTVSATGVDEGRPGGRLERQISGSVWLRGIAAVYIPSACGTSLTALLRFR